MHEIMTWYFSEVEQRRENLLIENVSPVTLPPLQANIKLLFPPAVTTKIPQLPPFQGPMHGSLRGRKNDTTTTCKTVIEEMQSCHADSPVSIAQAEAKSDPEERGLAENVCGSIEIVQVGEDCGVV